VTWQDEQEEKLADVARRAKRIAQERDRAAGEFLTGREAGRSFIRVSSLRS
jgi:hypothetical protein